MIYVKQGTYDEIVRLGSSKTYVMIVGDGMNKTIITGSLNVVDGSTTFNSATLGGLAAVGEGFILQDICIQNTAGPEKHQAVALRVGADMSAINRSKIVVYQNTLYPHSLRQFYRDSIISGTVDFIFGNAVVVLQNCVLEARLPMRGQKNMVTAQGRTDPNQITSTSVHAALPGGAERRPDPGKGDGFPWKEYSRTVFLQSYLDDHIAPRGCHEWDGSFALDTLFYGEYNNAGPGAGTAENWTGYHVITDAEVAVAFMGYHGVSRHVQRRTMVQPTAGGSPSGSVWGSATVQEPGAYPEVQLKKVSNYRATLLENYTAGTTPLEVLTLHRYDAARNWTSDEKRPLRPHLWG
ncbi:hypothetical protein Taro_021554 [Colocasia esculenta]|uniref:Pectinesterase n=1 Tax=Colocasia esculenta TaxID=4460 RepID=A0A843V2S5_COLES|nr:hypothetical protein [Colocasia esculenta]